MIYNHPFSLSVEERKEGEEKGSSELFKTSFDSFLCKKNCTRILCVCGGGEEGSPPIFCGCVRRAREDRISHLSLPVMQSSFTGTVESRYRHPHIWQRKTSLCRKSQYIKRCFAAHWLSEKPSLSLRMSMIDCTPPPFLILPSFLSLPKGKVG